MIVPINGTNENLFSFDDGLFYVEKSNPDLAAFLRERYKEDTETAFDEKEARQDTIESDVYAEQDRHYTDILQEIMGEVEAIQALIDGKLSRKCLQSNVNRIAIIINANT